MTGTWPGLPAPGRDDRRLAGMSGTCLEMSGGKPGCPVTGQDIVLFLVGNTVKNEKCIFIGCTKIIDISNNISIYL